MAIDRDTASISQSIWPTAKRCAIALFATTAFVLLLSACGGGPATSAGSSPNQGEATNVQKTVAFAQCMRSNGVPNYPDPTSNGDFDKTVLAQLEASNPKFPAAHRSCEHLLPNSGQPSQGQVQQAWNDMLDFALCMRSHGIHNWPDPTNTSPQDSRPFFNTPNSMDLNAPQIASAISACQHAFHSNNPLDTTQ